jgi:hypothetical protein
MNAWDHTREGMAVPLHLFKQSSALRQVSSEKQSIISELHLLHME